MIKTLIVDDEQHSIDRLQTLLIKHCRMNIQIIGTCNSVEEALVQINKYNPQLIFLDIQVKNRTGFDLLSEIPNKNFDVIFVTAYEKYAVQAFRFSAVDYLLKPVDPEELIQSVERIGKKKPQELISLRFETLLENVEQLKQYTPPKKIVVPTVNGFEFLPVIDILRCESEINYTTIFLKDKQKLVVAKTLKEFEEMLAEYNFFRVHNSHLVNLSYIKRYQKGKGGFVVMADGTEIEVSVRRKDDFIKKIAAL